MTERKREVKKHGRSIQKFNTVPRGVSEGEKREADREKTNKTEGKTFSAAKKSRVFAVEKIQ